MLRILVAVLLCLSVAGCSGYHRPATAFHENLTKSYRLDSGDQLRITVFGQDDLTNTYLVDQSGYITVPLIAKVAARGRTTGELAIDIAERLRNGYLRDPDVSAEIAQYRPFFIMGEVNSAGQYSYVAGMTAQTAVAIAGGFTARANQRDVVVTRTLNGKVLTGRVPTTDPIRPGDTIHVRERLF
ncbi:MAG: polysaccharide biosynthesis/export family protein [Pseudomonadota bacterium]